MLSCPKLHRATYASIREKEESGKTQSLNQGVAPVSASPCLGDPGSNPSSSLPPLSVSPGLHSDHAPASGSAPQLPEASVLPMGGFLHPTIFFSATCSYRVSPDDPCWEPGPGATKKALRDCHLPCGAAESQRRGCLAF